LKIIFKHSIFKIGVVPGTNHSRKCKSANLQSG